MVSQPGQRQSHQAQLTKSKVKNVAKYIYIYSTMKTDAQKIQS